jgi:hypothetical protein
MRQEKRSLQRASVAELVDATDSKSVSGDRVPVRVRPEVPIIRGETAVSIVFVELLAIRKVHNRDTAREYVYWNNHQRPTGFAPCRFCMALKEFAYRNEVLGTDRSGAAASRDHSNEVHDGASLGFAA